MEAAINNAGVVYHSDPRLILAYLAAGQAGVLSLPPSLSLFLFSSNLLSPLISSSPVILRYVSQSSEPRRRRPPSRKRVVCMSRTGSSVTDLWTSFRDTSGRRSNEASRAIEEEAVRVGREKERRIAGAVTRTDAQSGATRRSKVVYRLLDFTLVPGRRARCHL